VETFIAVADAPELDQDRPMMTDTIDLMAEVVVMTMIGFETEAYVVIVMLCGNARLARNVQRANLLHPSLRKMNVIGGLSLCNSLLLD